MLYLVTLQMNHILRAILFLSFYWAPPSPILIAQLPNTITTFSPDTGYPLRWLRGLEEDKNGFIWAASRKGLFRYDGHQFMEVREVQGDLSNLKGIDIRNMVYFEEKHQLWLVEFHSKTLYNFDIESYKVKKIELPKTTNELPNIDIKKDIDGLPFVVLWYHDKADFIGCNVDGKLEFIVSFRTTDRHWAMAIQAKGLYYFDSDGVNLWDDNQKKLIDLKLDRPNVKQESRLIRELNVNENGLLYYSPSENGIIKTDFYGQHKTLTHSLNDFGTEFKAINHLNLDSKGNLWVYLFANNQRKIKKLFCFTREGKIVEFTDIFREEGLFLTGLNYLIEDRNQNIWTCSAQGIIRFPSQQYLFNLPLTKRRDDDIYPSPRSISGDEYDNIYITTGKYQAVNAHPISKKAKNETTAKVEENIKNETNKKLLPSWNSILVTDTINHKIWFTGEQDPPTLNSYNYLTHKKERHKLDQENFACKHFIGICLTPKNNLLLGYKLNKIYHFNTKTYAIEKINLEFPNRKQGAPINKVTSAGDNKFWILSANELFLIDIKKNTVEYFPHEKIGFKIKEEFIVEGDSIIWGNALKGGLGKFNINNLESTIYSSIDGLANDEIASIVSHKNKLYIGTFNGLSVFDKETEFFQTYSTSHGLNHNEFNFHAKYKTPKGEIYLGTLAGVISFHPDSLIQETIAPPLQWVSYESHDKKMDSTIIQVHGFDNFSEIYIPPTRQYFELSWTLPDFTKPENNHYFTRLEGYEKNWQYRGSENKVRYNSLPAGDYVLHVKGSNPSGAPSSRELELKIKVGQYFYQSNWFLLLIVSAIGGLIYLGLRYRFNQKLKLERMRSRIASDLHDEVGSSLTHLSMLMSAVDTDGDLNSSKNYLKKGNEVLVGAIAKIRDVVWAIDARNDKSGNLIDRMEDFAFDMFNAKNINYNMEIENFNRELILPPLTRQNIYLIYKEAINNIVKHSDADSAKILLSKKGSAIILKIKDNGKDLNNKKVKGQGLSNMKLRAKRIGGEVKIEKKENGFLVELSVPI